MPRIKGKWKSKEKINWLILDKLVRKSPQNYPTLEHKGKTKLPHASVRNGIKYLQKRYLVSQVSIDKSIPPKPIITFGVTFLGQIVWFIEKMKNNTSPIIGSPTYFKEILPTISKNWSSLSKYYKVKHMEKLLAKVFSNIEILDDYPVIIKYKTFYRGVIMEFKNTQEHKIFHNILRFVDSVEFRNGFETIVNFAFLLELYKLYDQESYYHDKVTGIIGRPKINDWLKVVNSNKKFKKSIQVGFYTMKDYAERTSEGLRKDLDIIFAHEKPKMDKEIDEYRHNFTSIELLLSRTLYEYELEFQKDKVFRFDKFFKI